MEIENLKTIETEIKARLKKVINISWDIFLNHYINKKYSILLEAPFQLHFSQILENVGKLYCLKREEHFFVDLEVKEDEIGKKKYYIDIVCGIIKGDEEYKVALELKFKTLQQGAEDSGVMEFYKDIYSLEKIKRDKDYLFGVFLVITNDHLYIKKSKKGPRTIFETYNGASIIPDKEYECLDTKTGENFNKQYGSFKFRKQYKFIWNKYQDNYFLKLYIE